MKQSDSRPTGRRIGLYIWPVMLLTAISGGALAGGSWLASQWLVTERARVEQVRNDQEAVERLRRLVGAWRESMVAASEAVTFEVRTEALDYAGDLSLEILSEVEVIAGDDFFVEHQESFASIVGAAGRGAKRITSALEWPRGVSRGELEAQIQEVSAEAAYTAAVLDGLLGTARRRTFAAREAVQSLERSIGQALFGTSIGYVVMVLLLMRWTRKRVVDPIHELTDSARSVMGGATEDMRPLGLAPSELQELSTTFSLLVTGQRHAQQVAEQADRAKSAFLANMSHEIRTPMTAILGYAAELEEEIEVGEGSAAQRAAARNIRRSGDHLLQILNEILDLSKIEAGRLDLETIRFSPIELVSEVRSLMQVPAAEAALDLDVEYPTPLPEFIETDPTRLRQVLVNLVANAIKFTKAGQIRIVVRWLGSAGDPWIEFAVIDSGIGMTSEVIGRLFDPFTQADASTTRLYGGTGLGLSICQRLVELMRGSIDVESQPGVGSTFRLRLPVSPDLGARLIPRPAAVVWNAESPPGPGTTVDQELDCRILLAEDGEAIRELVSRMLTRAGAIVEVAIDGEAAVQRALAAESQIPFDVVLMDIQMPALDGYAATRALRRAGYKRPIIALTAHARAEDRTRCLAAGCDDVAAKPFDKRSLIGLISRHTRPPSTNHGMGDPPNT